MSSLHLLELPSIEKLSPESSEFTRLARRLPNAQQTRLGTLGGKRAQSFVLGRLLLLKLLKERTGLHWNVHEREALPPELIAAQTAVEPPNFNISHSGDWLLIGLSDEPTDPLGVDIERIRSSRTVASAELFANNEQLLELQRLASAHQASAVTRLWAQKEAWFKARQTAIFNPLLRKLTIEASDATTANLFCSDALCGYWLCVNAEDGPPKVISRYMIDPDSAEVFSRHDGENFHWQLSRGQYLAASSTSRK